MIPALNHYKTTVLDSLWRRQALTIRDRSLITVAAAIARNHSALFPEEMARALDNGISAAELSEVITHLAFYCGWGNAQQASNAALTLFSAREIDATQLPNGRVTLLDIDEQAEQARVAAVESAVGSQQFPDLVNDTTQVLFHSLWLRPDLAPRDRSLVTFSALVANGQSAQIGFHLNKAMDNGFTASEAAAALGQLAFYAGWPNAMSAVAVVKQVVAARAAMTTID